MNVGLIVSNNVWYSPYVKIYTRILEREKVDYEIISWNRDGSENTSLQFNLECRGRASLSQYLSFTKYSIEKIKERKFDKLIVLCPVMTIFMSFFLRFNYNKKYIVDYRDLSIDQKPLLKSIFSWALNHSALNVISSKGFEKFLPKRDDFLISHNFNIDVVKKALSSTVCKYTTEAVKVLTIGAIRVDMNPEIIDALGDKKNVELAFVGKGPASQELADYSRNNGFKNIVFKGYYNKEEEQDYFDRCNLINIFYPQIPSHQTALSNRFYNSLIYKRPMLVTKNSTQGDYVEKYCVGLAIENCNELPERLRAYLDTLDFESYRERCDSLLREFLKDYETWERAICNFFKE